MTNPPLSYSLPAWVPDGYTGYQAWLDDLQSLGFRWVTFTPTYLVYDAVPMRIDVSRGPAIGQLAEAVQYAVESGFQVRMEPHLDFETTLTGGPYEWRRRMYFSPLGQYSDEVVQPLMAMLRGVARPDTRLEFTLGSELDISTVEFSADWAQLIQPSGISIGHKINHDSLEVESPILEVLNALRVRRGLVPAARRHYRVKVRDLGAYLGRLDYVAFSFYPKVRGPGASQFAMDFRRRAVDLAERLKTAAGDGPAFVIGEFGLGSSDTSRPYHLDPATFLNKPEAFELRRQYYLGFLEFLRSSKDLVGDRGSAFWTVTYFDFLGVMRSPGMEEFRDDLLRQSVQEYNEEIQASP